MRAPRRAKITAAKPEAMLLHMVRQALQWHPLVAWHCRINSGAVTAENRDGSRRYVRFNDQPGMADLIGQLRDGRFLAIEVKREGWRGPKTEHEREQARFLANVRAANGVAGFVNSLEALVALLKSAGNPHG